MVMVRGHKPNVSSLNIEMKLKIMLMTGKSGVDEVNWHSCKIHTTTLQKSTGFRIVDTSVAAIRIMLSKKNEQFCKFLRKSSQ